MKKTTFTFLISTFFFTLFIVAPLTTQAFARVNSISYSRINYSDYNLRITDYSTVTQSSSTNTGTITTTSTSSTSTSSTWFFAK